MADIDFYENLDLRYMEIGIAMSVIDRMNPGSIPFYIPVLCPDISGGNPRDISIPQRSKTNIMNQNPGSVEVSDLTSCNYVNIEIPRELVHLPDAEYYVKGTLDLDGKFDSYSGLAGSGSVIEGGSINVSGTLSKFLAKITKVLKSETSKVYIWPTDPWRYIPKGSKWGIMFLGGDASMPRVVCRLPDDYVAPPW